MSDEGRKAKLADFAHHTLHELGRKDVSLARAKGELAELVAEARKVQLTLTPAQLALLPSVYAGVCEADPLMQPLLLTDAAEARDVLTLAAFLSAPSTGKARLAVTEEQLAAEPASAEKRHTLARMRELVDAAEFTRKSLVATLQRAAGIETDQLVLMARGEVPMPPVAA